MRKIAAFFTALFMFLIVVVGIHFTGARRLENISPGFGTWINTYKDLSYSAIKKNLGKNTSLMLGSSEFQHGKTQPYHPTQIFRNLNMDVMCIGAAYNQCLSHAITVGAVAPELKSKKVLLILSPSWFEKQGVKKEAFPVRFSESQYMALLTNPNISRDLKMKIAKRVEGLLVKAPTMEENVKKYDNAFLYKKDDIIDKFYFYIRRAFLGEKESININTAWKSTGKPQYEAYKKKITGKAPDWDKMIVESDNRFVKASTNNPFHIRDRIYTKKFKPVLSKQKNAMKKRQFWKDSPEYGDLDLFMQVCKESGIDLKLMLLPMNGYWYDFAGFQKHYRDELPGQIRKVTNKYGVELESYFDNGYNIGFLEDAFHPAGKGWTVINESAYKFFKDKK